MRNFKELEIWELGMQIVRSVYDLSARHPDAEKFNLTSQITRAAVSIPSNIAEGCAKSSEKEFKLYLERAHGSAFEPETQLLIISDMNTVEKSNIEETIVSIQNEQRKPGSFISSVKNDYKVPKNLEPRTQNQRP